MLKFSSFSVCRLRRFAHVRERDVNFWPKVLPYRPGGELHPRFVVRPFRVDCSLSRRSRYRHHEPGEFRGGREASVAGVRASGLWGPPLARAPYTAASGEGTEPWGLSAAAEPPGSAPLPVSAGSRFPCSRSLVESRPRALSQPFAHWVDLLRSAHSQPRQSRQNPESVIRGCARVEILSLVCVTSRCGSEWKPLLVYFFVCGKGKVRTSHRELGEHVFVNLRKPAGTKCCLGTSQVPPLPAFPNCNFTQVWQPLALTLWFEESALKIRFSWFSMTLTYCNFKRE